MEIVDERIEKIKRSILKAVPVKRIYLFGSHAYGEPTEESDIDIYTVLPDDVRVSEAFGKINYEFRTNQISLVDLLLNRESVFNKRKIENLLEETVYLKGKVLYENQ
jgi:predicted nucleotidyltransferase